LFIAIYIIVQKQIKFVQINTKSIQIIINFCLQLIIKKDFNKRYINLLIANKVALFLLNKYKNCFFRNIVLAKRTKFNKKHKFYRINYINIAYFFLYYIFFFL